MPLSSSKLMFVFGLVQAVVVAVGAYLSQPHATGRTAVIAVIGVVVSAAVSYLTTRKVKAAVAREVGKPSAP